MENKPNLPSDAPIPGTYRHYKGSLYQVFGMAQHSETDEWMVVYQALYGNEGFWIRPLSVWLNPVLDPNDPSAEPEVRFKLLTPSDLTLTQLTKPEYSKDK